MKVAMAINRITVDVVGLPLDSEEVERIKKDVEAHVMSSIAPDYEDDQHPFDRDTEIVNVTHHIHESSSAVGCSYCFNYLTNDERS